MALNNNFYYRRWILAWLGTLILVGVPFFSVQAYEKQSINFDANKSLQTGTALGAYEDVGKSGIVVTVSLLINLLLQILGVFSLALIFYGGWLWLSARGDQEKITQAKGILIGTTVGLFIILASYSISQAIFRQFVTITN